VEFGRHSSWACRVKGISEYELENRGWAKLSWAENVGECPHVHLTYDHRLTHDQERALLDYEIQTGRKCKVYTGHSLEYYWLSGKPGNPLQDWFKD
jgi:hypothetical protein